jgi:hypothetical protein
MRADAGLAATLSGPMVVTNNFCSGNIAGRDGGCFRVQTDGGTPLTVVNNRLTTNTGGNNQPGDGGGGMRVAAAGTALVSGTLTLTNNTLVNNTMVAGNGGGLRADVLATDTADFFNNIIIDNTAPGVGALGADIYLNNDAGSLTTLANNNFAGLFSLVPVAVAQANNILASPPGLTADLHLAAGSACIDAGLNAAHALPAADFEGEARIMGLAGIVDIGADEFFVAPPGPPIPVPTGTVISTLTLSAKPRVLRAGRTTTVLRGVLSDVNLTRLAGKRIAINVGRRTVKTVTTGPNGVYSAKIRTLRTRSFSATFAGDATYRPAASKIVRVIVR